MPSRTSGAGDRRSIATNPPSSAALAASVAAVTSPGTSGDRTTPSTSRSMPPVMVSAPARSKLRRSIGPTSPPSVSTRCAIASSSEAAITGAKNTHRHPTVVNSPPATMPSENPPAPAPP